MGEGGRGCKYGMGMGDWESEGGVTVRPLLSAETFFSNPIACHMLYLLAARPASAVCTNGPGYCEYSPSAHAVLADGPDGCSSSPTGPCGMRVRGALRSAKRPGVLRVWCVLWVLWVLWVLRVLRGYCGYCGYSGGTAGTVGMVRTLGTLGTGARADQRPSGSTA